MILDAVPNHHVMHHSVWYTSQPNWVLSPPHSRVLFQLCTVRLKCLAQVAAVGFMDGVVRLVARTQAGLRLLAAQKPHQVLPRSLHVCAP